MYCRQEEYFEGLPFEKVVLYGKECYKSLTNGCFYRIDEGKTFIAIECAGDEEDIKKNNFEDVDLYDKVSCDDHMVEFIRSELICLTEDN